MLAGLDAKKHTLDTHRPLSPAIVAKLKEFFDIDEDRPSYRKLFP